MTRRFASRQMLPVMCLAGVLAVSACQNLGQIGGLQAESPKPADPAATGLGTPPSQKRPPIAGATGPQTSRASVPAGRVAPGAVSGATPGVPSGTTSGVALGAQVFGATPPPDTAGLPPAGTPLARPDLPSLAHLLGRAPAPSPDTQPRPIVPPPATTDTVRVGLLLPLSGRNEAIGKALLNAAQLAMFDFADRKLELLPVDTKATSAGAAAAAQTAIGDGAQVILGPLLAGSVRAVSPAARAAHVPVLAFSSDRRVAGGGVYTMGFLPEDQVRRVVTYAVQRGITRFGALAPDNAYGATVFEALRDAARAAGAEVVAAQFYDPAAEDFTAVVRVLADYDNRREALVQQRKELAKIDDEVSRQALKRLENLQTIGDLPFDALLIADGGKRLQSVSALLPFYDIDPGKVQMLGTGQWDVPGLGAEPALLGGWYAAPDPAARQGFIDQYKAAYGKTPPRLATLAYDATALASVLARVQGGPDFSEAALTAPSGFDGRDGIFRLLPSGATERGLAVMQLRQRDAKVLQSAPATFQAAIN